MFYLGVAGAAAFTGIYFAYQSCCKREIPTDNSYSEQSTHFYSLVKSQVDKHYSTNIHPFYDVIQNRLTLLNQGAPGLYDMVEPTTALRNPKFNSKALLTKLTNATAEGAMPQMLADIFANHIGDLKNQGLHKHACILHDLLHLGFVLKNQEWSHEMTSETVISILTPSFLMLFREDKDLLLTNYMQKKLFVSQLLAFLITNPLFAKSFHQANPALQPPRKTM